MAIEALFLLINSGTRLNNTKILKDALKGVVTLCRVHPASCEQFVDIVGSQLPSSLDSDRLHMLCELLAALGHAKASVLTPLVQDVCMALESTAENGDKTSMTLLATMLFQTFQGKLWQSDIIDRLLACVISSDVDGWTAFKIARSAARYGHHDIAARITRGCEADSEEVYFWLEGNLGQLSVSQISASFACLH